MSLLLRINIFITKRLGLIRLYYLKLLCGGNFTAGSELNLKNTTRIRVWDKNGRVAVGDNFTIGYNSELYAWNQELTIGNSTSVNDNCKLYGNINIGANCLFASNIFMSSGRHNFKQFPTMPIRAQDKLNSVNQCITIDDDCWIGNGVVVMPGVYIGKGAVIGANSVVIKDVFPYTVNAGNPSRQISKRFDFDKPYLEIDSVNPQHWPFFYSGFDYKQFENTESLKTGLLVINDSIIVLLAKTNKRILKISGKCSCKATLTAFVNNEDYSDAQVVDGTFNLEIAVIKGDRDDHRVKYDRMPDAIKTLFDIVFIDLKQNKTNPDGKLRCEITSIGMA